MFGRRQHLHQNVLNVKNALNELHLRHRLPQENNFPFNNINVYNTATMNTYFPFDNVLVYNDDSF